MALDLQSFKGFTPGPWTTKRAAYPQDGEYDYAIGASVSGEVKAIAEAFGRVSDHDRPDAQANANLIAAAPDLLALAIKQETEIKRLKAALAVAKDFLSDRADHADDTGSNAEMECLSEITGIMEGYYPHG